MTTNYQHLCIDERAHIPFLLQQGFTVRRLENGDPGVSLGVLAGVLEAIGRAQELASMMDAAKDSDGLKAEVQRLPQRVRRSRLPVERISEEQLWAEKRARQAASYGRVESGDIPQSALFAFSAEQLRAGGSDSSCIESGIAMPVI